MIDLITETASNLLSRPVSIDELDKAKWDKEGDPILLDYLEARKKSTIVRMVDADGKIIEGQYYLKWHIDPKVEPEVARFQKIEIGDRPTFRRELEGHVEFADMNAINIDDYPDLRDVGELALSWTLGQFGAPVPQDESLYRD